jgi:hypothetical protein
MGFVPAGFAAGTPVVGTIEPVAEIRAPPELDPSPPGLSMAIETTADNLYFQASAKVITISPNRLISLNTVKQRQLKHYFSLSRHSCSAC